MTDIKGKLEFRSTTPFVTTTQLSASYPNKTQKFPSVTETMALVLNNMAVTVTTPSFVRPIPSPGPFSSSSGNSAYRSSERIFTYSYAYPIPHCIHRSGNFEVQKTDVLDSSSLKFDSVILDDDALTSLIIEMELDKMNVLPELQLVNADLADCNVLTTNRHTAS